MLPPPGLTFERQLRRLCRAARPALDNIRRARRARPEESSLLNLAAHPPPAAQPRAAADLIALASLRALEPIWQGEGGISLFETSALCAVVARAKLEPLAAREPPSAPALVARAVRLKI